MIHLQHSIGGKLLAGSPIWRVPSIITIDSMLAWCRRPAYVLADAAYPGFKVSVYLVVLDMLPVQLTNRSSSYLEISVSLCRIIKRVSLVHFNLDMDRADVLEEFAGQCTSFLEGSVT